MKLEGVWSGDAQESTAFDIACQAFALLTQLEKHAALMRFARLKNPVTTDRFFEAVHWVIQEYRKPLERQT